MNTVNFFQCLFLKKMARYNWFANFYVITATTMLYTYLIDGKKKTINKFVYLWI